MTAAKKRLFSPTLWLIPVCIFVLGTPLWMHWWEPGMFLAINGWGLVLPAVVWTGLSLLGNGWALLALTSPLMVWAPRLMWAWLCAAPFAALAARLGKGLLESPRPAAVVDNAHMRIVGEVLHNVSMPSGHTTTAFAVASALYFALPAAQRWRHAWMWFLAFGAGISRIAVGAHWPGDVVVGMALGIGCGLLGNGLLGRLPDKFCSVRSLAMRSVAVLVALAVYHLTTEALDFDENQPVQWVLAVVAAASLLAFAMRSVRATKAS